MQPAAAFVLEGLRHETGDETVFARRRLDDAFQEHRVVAGEHGIVNVPQVDLELALRVLGDRGLSRDALQLAPGVDVVQECLDFPEIVVAVNLRAGLRHAERRYARRARCRGVGLGVEQVELQLGRHDDFQPLPVQGLQGFLEHGARVREKRCAVVLEVTEHRLRHRAFRPRHRRHAARDHRSAERRTLRKRRRSAVFRSRNPGFRRSRRGIR